MTEKKLREPESPFVRVQLQSGDIARIHQVSASVIRTFKKHNTDTAWSGFVEDPSDPNHRPSMVREIRCTEIARVLD